MMSQFTTESTETNIINILTKDNLFKLTPLVNKLLAFFLKRDDKKTTNDRLAA